MSVQDIKKGRIAYFAGCSIESKINQYSDTNIVEQPKDKSKPVRPKAQEDQECFYRKFQKDLLLTPDNEDCLMEANCKLVNQLRKDQSEKRYYLSEEVINAGWAVYTYAEKMERYFDKATQAMKKRKRSDRIVAAVRIVRHGKPITLTPEEWLYLDSFGTLWKLTQRNKTNLVKWYCTLKDVRTQIGDKVEKVSYNHKSMTRAAELIENLQETYLEIRLFYRKGNCKEELTEKEIIDIFGLGVEEQKMFRKEYPNLSDPMLLKKDSSRLQILPIELISVPKKGNIQYVLNCPIFFKLCDERCRRKDQGLYFNTLIEALRAKHNFRDTETKNLFIEETHRLRQAIYMKQNKSGFNDEIDTSGLLKFIIRHDPRWKRDQIKKFNHSLLIELKQYKEAGLIYEVPEFSSDTTNLIYIDC